MKLVKTAMAGTMESSDIMVTIEPRDSGGIQLDLQSSVQQQYGQKIRAVILETLQDLDIENAEVSAVDRGALDCTIRARVSAAACRAADSQEYEWAVGK